MRLLWRLPSGVLPIYSAAPTRRLWAFGLAAAAGLAAAERTRTLSGCSGWRATDSGGRSARLSQSPRPGPHS